MRSSTKPSRYPHAPASEGRLIPQRMAPWLELVRVAEAFLRGEPPYRSGVVLAETARQCGLAPDGRSTASRAHARALFALHQLARAYPDTPAGAPKIALKSAILALVDGLREWADEHRVPGFQRVQAASSEPVLSMREAATPWYLKGDA